MIEKIKSKIFNEQIELPAKNNKYYLNCCKKLVEICEGLIKRNKLLSQQLEKIKSMRIIN